MPRPAPGRTSRRRSPTTRRATRSALPIRVARSRPAKGTSLDADDFISRTDLRRPRAAAHETTPTTAGRLQHRRLPRDRHDGLRRARACVRERDRHRRPRHGHRATTAAGRATAPTRTRRRGSATITSRQRRTTQGGRVTSAKDRHQSERASAGLTLTAYDELGRVTERHRGVGHSPDLASVTTSRPTTRSTECCRGDRLTARAPRPDDDLAPTIIGDRVPPDRRRVHLHDDARTTTATSPRPTPRASARGTCAAAPTRAPITHTYDALGRLTRSEVTAGRATTTSSLDATLDAAGPSSSTSATRAGGPTDVDVRRSTRSTRSLAEARADGGTATRTEDHLRPGRQPDRPLLLERRAQGSSCLQGVGRPARRPADPSRTTTATTPATTGSACRSRASETATSTTPTTTTRSRRSTCPTGSGKEHQTLYGYDTRHRLTAITQQLCTISSGHACSAPSRRARTPTPTTTTTTGPGSPRQRRDASSDRRYCYDALNRLAPATTGAAAPSRAATRPTPTTTPATASRPRRRRPRPTTPRASSRLLQPVLRHASPTTTPAGRRPGTAGA